MYCSHSIHSILIGCWVVYRFCQKVIACWKLLCWNFPNYRVCKIRQIQYLYWFCVIWNKDWNVKHVVWQNCLNLVQFQTEGLIFTFNSTYVSKRDDLCSQICPLVVRQTVSSSQFSSWICMSFKKLIVTNRKWPTFKVVSGTGDVVNMSFDPVGLNVDCQHHIEVCGANHGSN